MDYQVFLVSRVHEEWLAIRDNRRAVLVGLQQTRPVITASALIMVLVFSAFVTGDSRIIKLVGTGLRLASRSTPSYCDKPWCREHYCPRRGPPPGPTSHAATSRAQNDPLYRIRRPLLTGVEHLTDRQRARLDKHLPAGDPDGEVELPWTIHQKIREIYHPQSPVTGRRLATRLLDTLHTCPTKEIARLGRTLRQGREEILAYFATSGVSNGGTEAIGRLEHLRGSASDSETSPTTSPDRCSRPAASDPDYTLKSDEPLSGVGRDRWL